MSDHITHVEPDFCVRGMHTAVCSCGRIFGDWHDPAEAEREGREHEASPEQRKVEPWTPDKHPTPNYGQR